MESQRKSKWLLRFRLIKIKVMTNTNIKCTHFWSKYFSKNVITLHILKWKVWSITIFTVYKLNIMSGKFNEQTKVCCKKNLLSVFYFKLLVENIPNAVYINKKNTSGPCQTGLTLAFCHKEVKFECQQKTSHLK